MIPATGPEAADALAVPGLDYLLLDLTIPSLDLPALRALLRPGVPTLPDSLMVRNAVISRPPCGTPGETVGKPPGFLA